MHFRCKVIMTGQVAAMGGAVTMGRLERFEMDFALPTHASERITNLVSAGEYFGIALDLGRISKAQMETNKVRLEDTKAGEPGGAEATCPTGIEGPSKWKH